MNAVVLFIALNFGQPGNTPVSVPTTDSHLFTDIPIPGSATEVSTLFGTVRVKCTGTGTCGYIRTPSRQASFFIDGIWRTYDFVSYELIESTNPNIDLTETTVILKTL